MIRSIHPALSALRAFGQKLAVTANNIANMNTNGFKGSQAILEEAPPNGVTASISRIETPGAPLPPEEATSGPKESSNVAVEEEMVNLITAKQGYTANLKTIKLQDEVLGTLLDIVD